MPRSDGPGGKVTPRGPAVEGGGGEQVLGALRIPAEGRVYDLASGWWRGMPMASPHPAFELLTYRTPRGQRIQQDVELLAAARNTVNYGFVSELLLATTHSGTHIDALCHVTCGPGSTWHGGGSAEELLGDFGVLDADASRLEPIVARGVLLDVPAALDLDTLPAGFAIGTRELESACERQAVSVGAGDVVLVRTGQMKHWPDPVAMSRTDGAGVSLEGARWLSARNVLAVGADTVALEAQPSGIDGEPQPVHIHLIRDSGIPIMEWVNCEELAADRRFSFLFVALPLTIRGATGSMIRPIAIA